MFSLINQEAPVETSEPKNREVLLREPRILERVNNRIYFYSEIDRSSILNLNKELRQLTNDTLYNAQVNDSPTPDPMYLHINSFGGSIFHGLAGMDEILKARDKTEVITIVDGCCASAGTFLSVAGSKRYINKHAYMLVHQLSSMMWGKFSEFKDEMENLEKLMEMIKGIYKTYTKLPSKKLDEILKHDLWFSAEECLKYGLVDKII